MSLNWVASVLVHHPYLILIGLTVFSGTCIIIPLTFKTFPNFSDPQMGFETRGTVFANKITTWKNLVESTKPSGLFAINPREFAISKNYSFHYKAKKKKTTKKLKNEGIVHRKIIINDKKSNYSENSVENNWATLEKIVNSNNNNINNNGIFFPPSPPPLNKAGFFCGPPDDNYAQLIFKSNDDQDLFTLESLFKICRLETELVQATNFKDLCVVTTKKSKRCCRVWSLANYIALLNDRTSCLAITEEDVNATKALLKSCVNFFHNLTLAPECRELGHCDAPKECTQYDAVFNILNFLTSKTFLPPNNTKEAKLHETMIFLPMACSTAMLPYYYSLEKKQLSYQGVSVVAMEFGVKNALFDEYLLRDVWLLAVGGVFVIICMWLYTKSLFLTIMTIIAIVFSLGISYFLYTLIFELGFFPFMNLLAAIVAIGIGADDAFIFCKVWHSMKQESSSSLIKVMTHTLYHAVISMFVTSLTTAVAFLASYLSSITALRCFGVFAGTAVIANYMLMISWLPATIVIWDKYCFTHCDLMKSCFLGCFKQRWCCSSQWQLSISRMKTLCALLDRLWQTPETYILDAVIKFKFLFFITFTIIAIISSFIVFCYPKLQLPNSNDFQLFDSKHPFEQYDLVYKNKFWFKGSHKGHDLENNLQFKLPLRFIWGVLPKDNGNYMDPRSLGTLELDPSFNMSHPDSQKWLLNFCTDLRRQPFYQPTFGPLLPNCFIETFMSWMDRRCDDPINDNANRTPCCELSTFPYRSDVFDICILDAMSDLYETPTEYFIPGMAGPKFSKDKDTPIVKAIVVEYDSNYSYSMSYNYMKQFVEQVDNWISNKLETAPDTMRGGWFVSEVEFYDLQRVLSNNTLVAVVISMALALIVLFLTTLNILNSLYAIFTITCSITTTIALLVVSGWKLNILESVAISSAIGLTIDFSLHYTVNYRLSPNSICESRESATKSALSSMLGPITMAALTTGAAGAFMIPSQILAYKQIGQFLVTVMLVSWMFATFHLGSLLAIAGPERQFGQYYYSKLFCCRRDKNNVPENRATTSSISDTHELESLNSKSGLGLRSSRNLHRSLSGGKNPNIRNAYSDQSPSATSAITIIMADENCN